MKMKILILLLALTCTVHAGPSHKLEAKAAQRKLERVEMEKQRLAAVEAYLQTNQVTTAITNAMREGYLVRGMTKDQFTLAITGVIAPKISVTEGASGRREQWIWGREFLLNFENGVIEGWQDNTPNAGSKVDAVKLNEASLRAVLEDLK
jgi:hypothetical protein